jgi:hypothetical protein
MRLSYRSFEQGVKDVSIFDPGVSQAEVHAFND